MYTVKDYDPPKPFWRMTIPELVMAILMLTAFTGVFVLVARFTANFLQPINVDGERNFELAKDNLATKHPS